MKDFKFNMQEVERFLDRQGIHFKPLRAELLDHMVSDLEIRMKDGASFEHAWDQVKSEIPSNHLKQIQQQTMETIDSRFRISRIFSNLFISLIILGSFFKFMHWPGAGILLFASFGAITIALLFGSLSGVFLNKTRKGSIWVITMILGILLLLGAFCFKVFHLPGVIQLAMAAVVILVISSIMVTVTIFRSQSDGDTLLTFLHEKYTPNIQRVLLIMFVIGVFFKVMALLKGDDLFVGDLTLLLLIYGAGTHLLLFFWRNLESARSILNSFLVILCSLCLFLPVLNFYIPFEHRMVLAALFYISAGYLVYRFQDAGSNKPVMILFMVLNVIHFTSWSLMETGLLPVSTNRIIYSIPVVFVFLIPFWVFRKDKITLAYWTLCAAAFAFQFARVG